MLRLVLDTNVVLDLLHFADPTAAPLLAALSTGQACCYADEATRRELARVVHYPHFAMAPEVAAALVARYGQLAIAADPAGEGPPPLPRCRDRDDQKFLELAARLGVDFLVSKDKALLKLKGRTKLSFKVVTPAQAVVLLALSRTTN